LIFEERINKITNKLLNQNFSNEVKELIQISHNYILTLCVQFRFMEFNKSLLKKEKIQSFICQIINIIEYENLHISSIYILNVYIKHISDYEINISYIKTNFKKLIFTISNCEKDLNILILCK